MKFLNTKNSVTQFTTILTLLFLVLGISIRTKLIIFPRGLFLDEVNVALNIAERSGLGLFGNLDYDQHFPPLHLWLIDLWTIIVGHSEWALRFIPYVFGLLGLFLFYRLLRDTIKQSYLPMAILALSPLLIQFNTEVKQYSGDMLFTVIYLVLLVTLDLSRQKSYLLLLLFCTVAPWFSMPSIFLIGSLGLYILFTESLKNIKVWILAIGFIGSIILLYFVNLKTSLNSDHLQGYHAKYFLNFGLTPDVWIANINVILAFFEEWIGKTFFAIGSILLLTTMGLVQVFRNNKVRAIAIVSVFAATLLAAFLHKYSLITRLLIFWTPLIAWLAGKGLDFFVVHLRKFNVPTIAQVILVLGLFVFPTTYYKSGLKYIKEPLIICDPQSGLKYISEHMSDRDTLITTQFGCSFVKFYTQHYKWPIEFKGDIKYYWSWKCRKQIANDLSMMTDEQLKHNWVFDGHTFGELRNKLEKDYTIADFKWSHFCESYRIEGKK